MVKTLRKGYLYFKNMDKGLLFGTLFLAALGVVMILTSSSITAGLSAESNYNSFYYFTKQLIFVIVSLIGCTYAVSFIKSSKYDTFAVIGIIICAVMSLIEIIKGQFSSGIQEVTLDLGITTVQPAEFFKILFVVYLGSFFAKWLKKEDGKKKNYSLLLPMILCCLPTLFILIGGDFGSAAILIAIIGIMILFISTNNIVIIVVKWFIWVGLIIVLSGLLFAHHFLDKSDFSDGSRWARILYKDPCFDNYLDIGYQACNGYIAMDNGGLFGVGFGQSTQKYLYLTHSHTDFIFPIVVEEMGILGGLFVIGLYLFIIFRIFYISSRCLNLRDSLICFGIGLYMFIQVSINLGGVLAIFPLTGVPLPLLSYGGSNCLATFIGFTIVQRICSETKIEKKKKLVKKQ